MGSWKRKTPGDKWHPPFADQQNAWDETAEFRQREQRLGEKIPDQRVPVHLQLNMVKVKNETNANLKRGAVVQLNGKQIKKPDRIHPWFKGGTPTSRCKRFAVLVRAVKSGHIEDAYVSGPTFALVDITKGDARCAARKGKTYLVGDDDGPIEILWKPEDKTQGIHECLVELEQNGNPVTYVAMIPQQGISAVNGTSVSSALCEIYRVVPDDEDSCGSATLEKIILPDGTTLKKCIRNTSAAKLSSGFKNVHRDECGNWLASDSAFGSIAFTMTSDRTRETVGGNNLGKAQAIITDIVGVVPNPIGASVEVIFVDKRWLEAVTLCQGRADYIDGSYVVTECQGLVQGFWFRTLEDRTSGAPDQDVMVDIVLNIGHANDDLPRELWNSTPPQPPPGCGNVSWSYTTYPLIGNPGSAGFYTAAGWVDSVPANTWWSTAGYINCTPGCSPVTPTGAGTEFEVRVTDCSGTPSTQGQQSTVKVRYLAETFPRMLTGALGYAQLDNDITNTSDNSTMRYYVVQSDQQSLRLASVLAAKMCGTNAQVEEVASMTFWPFSQVPENVTSIPNPHSHYGRAGDKIKASWNEHTEQYEVDEVDKHVINAATNLSASFDEQTNCTTIGFLEQTIAVELCEDPVGKTLFSYRSQLQKFVDELEFEKNEVTTGSGENEVTTCEPILRLKWIQQDVLTLCTGATYGEDEISMEQENVVVEVNMNGCPYWVNKVIFVMGSCGDESREDADCNPCPTQSGSGQ